jgi:hypothetical protein
MDMDEGKDQRYKYLICNSLFMLHRRESGTDADESGETGQESRNLRHDEVIQSRHDEITVILDQANDRARRDNHELAPLTAAQEALVHELMGDAYLSIGDLDTALEEYSAGRRTEKLLDVGRRLLDKWDLENAERAYRAAGRELPGEHYLVYAERILASSPERAAVAFRKAGAIARLIDAADQMRALGDTSQGKHLDVYWEAQSYIPEERLIEIADLFLDSLRLAQARQLYGLAAAEIPTEKLVAYASKKVRCHWGDTIIEPYAILDAIEIYSAANAGGHLVRLAADLIERHGRQYAWRQALEILLKANAHERIGQLARELLADGELIASMQCQEASGRKEDVERLLRAASKAKFGDRMAVYIVALEETHFDLTDPQQSLAFADTRVKLLDSLEGCFQELERVINHDELVPRIDYLERAVRAFKRNDLTRKLAAVCEGKGLAVRAAGMYAEMDMVADARRVAKKLLDQRKLEEAKAAYEAATLSPHDDFVAWGSHEIEQGNVKTGIAAYRQVGEEVPKDLVLKALRSKPHVFKSLEELLSLFRECGERPGAETLSTFGDWEIRSANWSEAVETYRMAGRDLPKKWVLECADCYLAHGDIWNGEMGYGLVGTSIPPEKLKGCAAVALKGRNETIARRCMQLIVGGQGDTQHGSH